MESKIEEFKLGELYSNEDIFRSLGVSNAGGVRLCLYENSAIRRIVIFTSEVSSRVQRENPYHDRIEGNILVYTGAGKQGDQSLSGYNARLPQQASEQFPIYLFSIIASRRNSSVGPKRWRFLGLTEYLRNYQETQIDIHGVARTVWIFEFVIHNDPKSITVSLDEVTSRELLSTEDIVDHVSQEDRQVELFRPVSQPQVSDLLSLEPSRIRERLLSVSPTDFEQLIKKVLLRTGFERVEVTRPSQDGGVDVNAYPSGSFWALRDLLVQIQAKRWLHTVGRREVAELRGSLEPFARGVVVTTSHFSRAAITEASAPGKNPIGLIDGNQFANLILTLGPDSFEGL